MEEHNDEAEERGPTDQRGEEQGEPRAADLIEPYVAGQRQSIDDLLAECTILDTAFDALRGQWRLTGEGLEPRLDVGSLAYSMFQRPTITIAIGPSRIPGRWWDDDVSFKITCFSDWVDEEAAENDGPIEQMRVAAQGHAPQRRKLEPLRQEIVTILRDAGLVVTP